MAEQLAAGWYVDPSDAQRYRWWAGDQWTTHTRDKAEVDASVDPFNRPLPDFDAEPAPKVTSEPRRPDGRRRVPVLLLLAVLVGVVASAGIVAFRPDTSEGHQLTGELRVPADAIRSGRRAPEFLGDGAPCGGGDAPGVGAGTRIVVNSARGDRLGATELGQGVVDRTINSVSCVFTYAVDDVDDAQVYVVKVGRRVAGRTTRDAVESSDWILDLRLG
jgi:hypothetical protein